MTRQGIQTTIAVLAIGAKLLPNWEQNMLYTNVWKRYAEKGYKASSLQINMS